MADLMEETTFIKGAKTESGPTPVNGIVDRVMHLKTMPRIEVEEA